MDEVQAAPATPAPTRFDASSLQVDKDSIEIEIYNTKDDDCPPTGIFIEVLSRDAPEYKAREQKIYAALSNSPTRRIQGAKMTPKERVALGLAMSVASVKSWRIMPEAKPVILWDGNELDCTDANVHMVLQKSAVIREQVDATSLDRGNFSSR